MTTYILHNPLSKNGTSNEVLKKYLESHENLNYELVSVIDLEDKKEFLKKLKSSDRVIIFGGDGTVNHFANDTYGYDYKNDIYYCPSGTGNDLASDLKAEFTEDGLLLLNPYLNNLPTLYVEDKELKFINGVGYGIDGYCCTEGIKKAAKSTKPVNYTSIAINLLLFSYKPRNAKVTIDGVTKEYKHVWLAPCMKGRFYGGGMMVTPAQDRSSGNVSVCVFYKSGKLKTLMVFPSIFKGEHINHKECVEILSGKEVTIEFDKPTDLQVDGEVFYNITKYTVKA